MTRWSFLSNAAFGAFPQGVRRPNIREWAGAGSLADWEFYTTEPSRYRLTIHFSCPAEDDYSEWQVTAEGKRATFPRVDSGERPKRAAFGGALPRFRSYRIGRVGFERTGRHSLSVGPVGSAGKGMRIAWLALERLP